MNNHTQTEIDHFNAQSSHWWEKNGPLKTLHDINPARLAFIHQHTSISDKVVLDVGCGGGILSESMAEYGAKVTGIDLGSNLIEIAKQHAAENQWKIDYQTISLEEYNEQHSACFDLVTCMEMLEHVPHPEQILSGCANALKPNGWLFVSTINKTHAAKIFGIWVAEYLLHLIPQGTHHYEQFIEPHQLVNWARNLGLAPRKLMGLHYNPINREATLRMPANINYLMAFQKVSSP